MKIEVVNDEDDDDEEEEMTSHDPLDMPYEHDDNLDEDNVKVEVTNDG